MALTAVVLGLSFGLGRPNPAILLGLVAILSVLWDLPWVVNNAVPGWILRPDQLFRAQGLLTASGGLIEILGYAGGGVLLATAGSGVPFFVYAALLILAALSALPLNITVERDAPVPLSASFRAGWDEFRGESGRPLRELGILGLVRDFFLAAPTILAVLLASRFPGPTSAYGAMFVAYVVGAVAGGVIVGRFNPRHQVGALMLGTTAAMGGLFAGAYLGTPFLVLALPFWVLAGGCATAYVSGKYAYLQATVSTRSLGRVVANLFVFTGVSSSIGSLVLGGLAHTLTLSVFTAIVVVGLLGSAAVGILLPKVRHLSF
jgi:hypothetical protein